MVTKDRKERKNTAKSQAKAGQEALNPKRSETEISPNCQSRFQETGKTTIKITEIHMAWNELKVQKVVNQRFASTQCSIFPLYFHPEP